MSAIRSKIFAYALWSLIEEDKRPTDEVARRFFSFLESNHVLHLVPATVRHLERMHEAYRTQHTLYIRMAHRPDADLVEAIRLHMDVPEDSPVIVEEDSNVVGGFVGRYGETVYDASIQKQLSLLRSVLLK